ncbi:hypothetical protein BpHYR1_042381 [Brachionus plicatilis]|uniref:Uncharacterized protein n=1 Tax=Brachionus plicatilis TaxID=10195 RepID=A0A3M7QET0_BRAPC|nr:hypothetical protein BpHYR1_042381 [Brachionus plicatilis]
MILVYFEPKKLLNTIVSYHRWDPTVSLLRKSSLLACFWYNKHSPCILKNLLKFSKKIWYPVKTAPIKKAKKKHHVWICENPIKTSKTVKETTFNKVSRVKEYDFEVAKILSIFTISAEKLEIKLGFNLGYYSKTLFI